ncbi:MAG: hypothetical protein K0U52_02240 [Gammaproteobacteria bacterium]|nr:hypothetical protein [Gammaproteobacteria bacterium]
MEKTVPASAAVRLWWVLAIMLAPSYAAAQADQAAINPLLDSAIKAAPLAGIAWWMARELITMIRASLAEFRTTHEQGMERVGDAIDTTRSAVEALDRKLERIDARESAPSSGGWGHRPLDE